MNPWPARAPVPALTEGALHLWSASLDATPERLAGYRSLLNSEELGRAGRFRFARDHDRYVMGRGILRTLLARYAELPDGRAVKLAYGPHGKPSLAAADGLRFNLSHADDFALYAFTRGVEIGVDVERVRDLPDLDATMRASFADAERRHIEALPTPVEQRDAFYRCWTRKEAVLKALGWGLAVPLDSFEVSVQTSEEPRLISLRGKAVTGWRLAHLEPAPGFAAAAAWQGSPLVVACQAFRQ